MTGNRWWRRQSFLLGGVFVEAVFLWESEKPMRRDVTDVDMLN